MNSLLARQHIEGRFTLLAWRSLAIQAQPGLALYVRSGIVRVREPGRARPRVLDTGMSFAAHRGSPIEISAFTNAELEIEWPSLERLSPGLEPIAMEPIARASRP
jgi:hypothetical protein